MPRTYSMHGARVTRRRRANTVVRAFITLHDSRA